MSSITTGPADTRARFSRLSSEWKAKSRHMSNTTQMAMLEPYQRIIGMGWDAVPLILEELKREPDYWFWALTAITEENPVAEGAAGKLEPMTRAWLDWGMKNKLLES